MTEIINSAENVQERAMWVLMELKSPVLNEHNLQRYMRRLKDATEELDKAVGKIVGEKA